ncbi:MAG: transcriptional repressor LexA [Methylococcales bacterium]
MRQLTSTQKQILAFVKQSLAERQMPPTVHEIAQYMDYRSDNAAYQHLISLERRGLIELKGHSRGIFLLEPSGLPVLGRVAAGTPILAEENIEFYLGLDPGLFHPKADFLLRVEGMSMRDAGILNGDLLAVQKIPLAQNNQIVVARLDDEVTVKRFRRRQNIVTLFPENPDFEPIRVDLRRRDLAIEGVMAGLIRREEVRR